MNDIKHIHEQTLRAYTDAMMMWVGVAPRIVSMTSDYLRQQAEVWATLHAHWLGTPPTDLSGSQGPLSSHSSGPTPAHAPITEAQTQQTRRRAQAQGSHLKQAPRQRPKKREH